MTIPSPQHARPHRRSPRLGWLVYLTGAGLVSACSAGTPIDEERDVGLAAAALGAACTLETVGLPCDPDGGGGATECEGLCWIGTDRQPVCLGVAALGMTTTELNGRICGDATGQDCGSSCENGQCVNKNARLGTACRPDRTSNTCEGLCTLLGGEPRCDRVTACEDFGIDGCMLRACGFDDNTTGCQDYALSAGTSCSDGLDCTTGDACDDDGVCAPEVDNCGPSSGGSSGTTGGSSGTTGGSSGTTGGSSGTTGGSSGTTGGSSGTTGGSSGTTGGSSSTGAPGASSGEDDSPVEITGGGCSMGGPPVAGSLGGLLLLLGLGSLRRRGRGRELSPTPQ